jgi:integrase
MDGKQQLFSKVIDAFKQHRFNRQDAQEYLDWIKLFLSYHQLKSPMELDQEALKDFLRYLCDEKGLMPSRQKQAYLALNFFYKQVLHRSLWSAMDFGRESELMQETAETQTSAKDTWDERLPKWTRYLQQPYQLIAQINFLCGLKLDEVLNLRVEDIDLEQRVIRIRDAFGDFSEMHLSDTLHQPLELQLKKAYIAYQQDCRQGNVMFQNPNTFQRKQFTDNPRWYFLFPGTLQFNLNTHQRIRKAIELERVEQAFKQAREQHSEKVLRLQPTDQVSAASF